MFLIDYDIISFVRSIHEVEAKEIKLIHPIPRELKIRKAPIINSAKIPIGVVVTVLDITDLAFWFIKDVVSLDKSILETRYDIKIEQDAETLQIFDDICVSKKCLLKQGELDYDRCARMIIDDFRKGKLGKIILD